MPITFVTAGTLAAVTTGTTLTTTVPAGTLENDILILSLMHNSTSTFSTPSGWTLLGTSVSNTNQSTAWFWMRRGASAPSNPASTTATMNTTISGFGRIYVFRGCLVSGTPIEGVANNGTPTTSTTPSTSAVTTTGTDRMVVSLLSRDFSTTPSSGFPPAGWTGITVSATTTGGDGGMGGVYRTQATASTVSAATIGTWSAAAYWRTLSFALIPEPTVAPSGNEPTFVAAYPSTLNSTTSPRTITGVVVEEGDLVVVSCAIENAETVTSLLATAPGYTFTQNVVSIGGGFVPGDVARSSIHSAVAPADGTITVTVTRNSGLTQMFGCVVTVWRNHGGVGATHASDNATGTTAPSGTITTTEDNSAIVAIIADWTAANGARAYLIPTGVTPDVEDANYADASVYGLHAWHHVDAWAAGAKTIGMSAPTQRWAMSAIEILPSAGGVEILDRTATGTLALSGSTTQEISATRTATGTVTLSGSATATADGGVHTRTATGTATLGGTAVATAFGGSHTRTATGGLTLSGTATGTAVGGIHTRTATGTLTATGDATATAVGGSHTRTATGVATLSGTADAAAFGGTHTRTATGTLAASGAATISGGAHTRTSTGILTLSGTAASLADGGTHTRTAVGSLSLAGSASAIADGGSQTRTALGSLTLEGTAPGGVSGGFATRTATGTLTLDGTASAAANGGVHVRTATGTLTASGIATRELVVITTATGSISLSGEADTHTVHVLGASGSLSLSGSAVRTIVQPGVAIGTLTLSGTAQRSIRVIEDANGELSLTGDAPVALATTANGSLTLSGTGDQQNSVVRDVNLELTLSGSAQVSVATVAGGELVLSGNAQRDIRTAVSGAGTLTLSGSIETLIRASRDAEGVLVVGGSTQGITKQILIAHGIMNLTGSADAVDASIPPIPNTGLRIKIIHGGYKAKLIRATSVPEE